MKEAKCFKETTNIGCLDFISKKTGETTKNVSPLFYVQSIMRDVENPNGLETLVIYVNDHNKREYTFNLETDKIHSSNLTAELAKNGVMIDPFWHLAVVEHLLYGYNQCVGTDCIVYQNNVLGWYPFEGKEYYFFDETDFDGNHSICSRKKTEFRKGDYNTYLKFLQDTVFPSTELSLALAIGYSAVVVSKLNGEYDLRNSNC